MDRYPLGAVSLRGRVILRVATASAWATVVEMSDLRAAATAWISSVSSDVLLVRRVLSEAFRFTEARLASGYWRWKVEGD